MFNVVNQKGSVCRCALFWDYQLEVRQLQVTTGVFDYCLGFSPSMGTMFWRNMLKMINIVIASKSIFNLPAPGHAN